MFEPAKERNYLPGIYLSASDAQPRFRQVCEEMSEAREYIRGWLSHGYVDSDLDDYKQDHYAPSRIFKVRIMPVTEIIVKPKSDNALERGFNDEKAYWTDESGSIIDPHRTPM